MSDKLFTDVAALMVEAAESLMVPRWRKLGAGDIKTKSSETDLVTIADTETEEFLTPRLADLLPGSKVLGEEAASTGKVSANLTEIDEPLWIIDPIDGTRAFASGEVGYCSMVALAKAGETIGAWIYYPGPNNFVWSQAGAGAFETAGQALDTQTKLQTASRADEALKGHISTKYFPEHMRATIRQRVKERPFAPTEPMQAAGIEYRSLARGSIDFSVFYMMNPWDHVPGGLILEEAGGSAETFAGKAYGPRVLTGGLVAAANTTVARTVVDRWELTA